LIRQLYALTTVVSCLFIFGCAYDSFEHFTYDASHTRQCIKDVGSPNCEPDRPSYEEYTNEKNKILNDN